MWNMFKALWAYRGFVLSSIKNEFISRFVRSKLGGLWMIIHPLAQVAIFALILSNVLAAKLPGIDNKNAYALYLMAGTLAWNLFSEIIHRCLTLFIDQGNVMKKVYFPRITLPAIVLGLTVLNNLLLMVSILLVFALMGHPPTPWLIWLPVFMLIVTALGLGIGLLLGVINVFVRDVGQVTPVLMQILFWFTPIVYPLTAIPEDLRKLLIWNPMFPIVRAYQSVLVFDEMPAIAPLLLISGVAFFLLLLGLFVFRRSSPELVDAL